MTAGSAQTRPDESDKIRLRLWLRLLKMSRGIEGQLRENFRTEFDSTLPRFDVMAALYRYPKGLKMNELSGVLKVSNGNVTGIVDRLLNDGLNDGLISRNPVPGDRRALLVCLTSRGKKEFKQQAEQHEQWIDELLASIPIDDAAVMMHTLELAIATYEEKDGGA